MRSSYGVEGSLELIGYGRGWGLLRVPRHARAQGRVGLLRLRICFATRSKYFAQDDREISGFSFGQFSYQLQVGFEKIERRQIGARGPAHVFENPVLDFAFVFTDCIET